MNIDVKTKWLAALRSGKYKQTHGLLARIDDEGEKVGHCCLGVLCEIAVEDGIIPKGTNAAELTGRDYDAPDSVVYGDEEHDSTVELPEKVREWAGFDTGIPPVEVMLSGDESEITYGLAELNDEYDQTFVDIAAIIEAQF